MATKRKRSSTADGDGTARKRRESAGRHIMKCSTAVHSLLSRYYETVCTLREYLAKQLSPISKVRRRKIVSFGGKGYDGSGGASLKDAETKIITTYLDNTLVGIRKPTEEAKNRHAQWVSFSQQDDSRKDMTSGVDDSSKYCHSEIVDFVIWSICTKCGKYGSNSQHLLSRGFRKTIGAYAVDRHENPMSTIPGLVATCVNDHVTRIKSAPWPQILALLGRAGEQIMIDLLIDCGLFLAVNVGEGNYDQLSGIPLGDLQESNNGVPQASKSVPTQFGTLEASKAKSSIDRPKVRNPGSITIVRNRMLYAKPALNARGQVKFGFRHIHVLNRLMRDSLSHTLSSHIEKSEAQKGSLGAPVHIMMYIFPRQFGLHNVFTSSVNTRQTTQPFKDYTMREEEIRGITASDTGRGIFYNVPKRLRGDALHLVGRLQLLHRRCPYTELLNTYCPANYTAMQHMAFDTHGHTDLEESTALHMQESHSTFTRLTILKSDGSRVPQVKPVIFDRATPPSMVSIFCRAVLSRLIPDRFWGEGSVMNHNKRTVMKKIDQFIHLRRYESMTLHQVIQGIKINDIGWLAPNNAVGTKPSQSDTYKRLELFLEFIYYVFDSLLIPLIRNNFHVTESNVHRYKLFFFRHDVWRSLTEPTLASLKLTMFAEIQMEKAQRILNSRRIGFSQIRLLPKESGVRPIMNLRRRTLKKGYKDLLGPSINSVLSPVHTMLTYEKTVSVGKFGSSLFSVGDLYAKIKAFRQHIALECTKPLLFVKVDVEKAFDTIPQATVVRLLSSLPRYPEYCIKKHVEIKPGERTLDNTELVHGKPIRRWRSVASSTQDPETFEQHLMKTLAIDRKNTIFVGDVNHQVRSRDELLKLLEEHITCNMVKIGKKFYRQKEGIPQGSILSSLVCNYFYADLEAQHLQFLQAGNSLLLRLIDDFLLITTECEDAKRFLGVMHGGLPEYGVRVNPSKSLVNFETSLNGRKIARLVGTYDFPYCGTFINTKTLDISKNREGRIAIADSLTIEFSKVPGKTFHRKVLNTFKIQSHAMFLDTSMNSLFTVISNIHANFIESATKLWTYRKCLPKDKKPGARLVIKTISDLIALAFVLIKSKSKAAKSAGYQCAVTKAQVEWLACTAFRSVLGRRQTAYTEVLEYLDARRAALDRRKWKQVRRVRDIVKRYNGEKHA